VAAAPLFAKFLNWRFLSQKCDPVQRDLLMGVLAVLFTYIFYYLNIFGGGANAFFSLFKHINKAYKVNYTQQQCYDFPKKLIPWRDSNPSLMFLLYSLPKPSVRVLYTYIHTCIHTYIHTYIHTCLILCGVSTQYKLLMAVQKQF
jgi:hypothetical protein